MATENKTQPTQVDFVTYLESVEPENRRDEARIICALMEKISQCPPVMWGPSIVGFGTYHYRYDSGRSGSHCRIAFSPRKAQLTLYMIPGSDKLGDLLAQLGPHTTAKSCLYIKKLSAIQLDILEAIITASWQTMAERYPD
jgi:hypothetical protein